MSPSAVVEDEPAPSPTLNGITTTKTETSYYDVAPLSSNDYMRYEDEHSVSGMPAHRVVMHRALGSYLWDREGRKYIDLLSAFGSVNQGHCHPRITAAVVEQCKMMTISGRATYNEPYSLMCKTLSEVFGFDQLAATNSGSEAVDFAVKLCRKWAYQKKGIPQGEAWVLTASGNYHGRTMCSLSASTNTKIKEDCGPFTPNIGSAIDGCTNYYGSVDALRTMFQTHGRKIAALMIEGVQGNAGCLPVPDGYLRTARELCDEHNVLFVCDDIQGGLGRSGYLVNLDRENVKPDILLLGKSVTGGAIPMGIVLTTRNIMSLMKPGQYGSTFAGNPMACAAALAGIKVIVDEKLPERANQLGKVLLKRLSQLDSPYVARATGQGLFCSLWLKEDPSGRVTGRRLAALLLRRGVLTYAYGDKIRVSPPLNIEEDDLWYSISTIERALQDLPLMAEPIPGE